MRERRPVFYTQFACLASRCEDTCCAGWEIEIDPETYERYRSVPGDFGVRLRESIRPGNPPCFRLEGERCVFLNEENLCDLYIHLGKSALCGICAEHPRFHQWYGEEKESGLGLCCPAAGALLFASPDPLRWEFAELSEPADPFPGDRRLFLALRRSREAAFRILQDRKFSIFQRAALLLVFGEEVQRALDGEFRKMPVPIKALNRLSVLYASHAFREKRFSQRYGCKRNGAGGREEEKKKLLDRILEFYQTLEAMDASWPGILGRLREEGPVLLDLLGEFQGVWREYEYEHFLVYWVDRYWLQAFFSGDILSVARSVGSGFWILLLLGLDAWNRSGKKQFSPADQVHLAHIYSKEIEYCGENLEALAEECWMGEAFSASAWETLFLSL